MACPNNSTTVNIPHPTGTADVVMYDQNCIMLAGTDFRVYNGVNTAGILLGPTTSPTLNVDSAGLHFSAGSAVRGSVIPLFIVHVPSGKTTNMTATVGAPVTSISASTTTP